MSEQHHIPHIRAEIASPACDGGFARPAPMAALAQNPRKTAIMSKIRFARDVIRLRDSLPYGQRPTDLDVRIAWLLARWQNNTPSHEKLARAAHCCVRSVGNAMNRLRDLGVLDWKPRFIRLAGGHWARATNSYFFPEQSSLPTARAARPRPTTRSIKQPIFKCPATVAGSIKPGFSMAEITARRHAALVESWNARRSGGSGGSTARVA